ncbi:class I adenylate-forming enzyme family protein [Bradyrhizobium erythrophlei]|uniref:Long-chain acyl-CoA synthetase/feruloyl-CoA synthase n=1 Tax=Bradyrhizobium erythrophlei TaxID=1437360 RepID=A0A1M5W1D3_9BRAD|nr:class I adenylate-forming enzyme family protein [Bradyrhizobium erythrophlei]SHH81326.1 long-chain acyl-CoA synthetase/feruloyl-CoA synthase [Bradyrhizobium erythrophlei]
MKMTPMDALLRQSETRPQSTAFVFGEQVWTYKRLAIEAERLARGLAKRGIGPGDRVVLHMMNRPEMIIAYYACFKLGAIAAPLRTAFKFAELAPLLQRLKPAIYIGEIGLYENVAPVDASILPRNKRFIVNGTFEDHGVQPWEGLFDEASNGSLRFPAASYKPAVLINTSGTTGQPKFVVHTPATLSESVDLIVGHWGFSDDDVMLLPLPMAHMSGLICLLSFVQFGAPFVLLEGFDADAVLDTIERHGCTWCIGFPAQYAALLESQRAQPRNLGSLRICLTGADVCPIDLQDQVTSTFGVHLRNFWAATEAVGSLTFGLQRGPVVRIQKGARIRLVDENGADVADGEPGELLIRGANVFEGYWNDPRATEECLKAGWYHTGDLMRRGENDELWFVSRKKDIIIRGGTNISPPEVEQALVASHSAVEQAAVVGIPDAVFGQRVFGFVKLADGTKDTVLSEILSEAARRLASYKVPERLLIIEEMPRNALSKVDRNALLAMASRMDAAGRPQIGAVPVQPRQRDARPVRRVAGNR